MAAWTGKPIEDTLKEIEKQAEANPFEVELPSILEVAFYGPDQIGKQTRLLINTAPRKLGVAVKQQLGSESEQFGAAGARTEEQRDRIAGIINNLLDNITSTNCEFVEGRPHP